MARKLMIRSFLALAAFLLLLLIPGAAWFAFDPGFRWGQKNPRLLASTPKDEFEQRVQSYLLDHPEVIIESLNRMETRQRAAAEAEAQTIVSSRSEDLFRDANTPVVGNANGDVTLVEFFDYNCPYCPQ